MSKKILALVLTLCMVVSLAACGKKDDNTTNENGTEQNNESESGKTDTDTSDNTEGTEGEEEGKDNQAADPQVGGQLVIGTITEPTGDWSPYWANNAADFDIWNLISGYSTVTMNQSGEIFYDPTVVKDCEETVNEDGSKTFTYTINEGLVYNNGDPIKAKDFVASVLFWDSPLITELGATDNTYFYKGVGWKEFSEGKTKEFAGVRLLGEYQFSVTLAAENLPYYYDKTMVSVAPLNMKFWLGPDADLADDGKGAYFTDAVTAKNCKDYVEKARFATKDFVSCGPYQVVNYDESSKTVTLEINDKFAGDFSGQKPYIQTLIYKKVLSETAMDELKTGSVDLLMQMSLGDEITAGMDLVDNGGFSYNAYDRNGYGELIFVCDFGPTQFKAVRQAIAHLLDRNDFCQALTGGYGSVVNGEYGTAMWQYQERADELEEKLNPYPYSLDEAKKVLEEDGWVYDEKGNDYTSGIRYKKLEDGTLMPLIIEWCSSEKNDVSQLLVSKLQNNPDVAKAGIKINQTIMTFTELLNYYYRSAEQDPKYGTPTYHMFNMATGFTTVFDRTFAYSTDEKVLKQGMNHNYLVDKELEKLAKDMVDCEPEDKEKYLDTFVKYQIKWNELLPNLPLYSNEYHDFFNSKLKNYKATDIWGIDYAIVYAYIDESGEE